MDRQAFPATTNRSRGLRFVWRFLARCYDRYLQRLDLQELDDDQLRDIGLTPKDVRRECAKSVWRPGA